jgi:hypothetical protein
MDEVLNEKNQISPEKCDEIFEERLSKPTELVFPTLINN